MIHFDCTYSFLSGFVRSGAIAMSGFMFLSGYILTMTNYTKDILSPQSFTFYKKKIVLIVPLYYSIAIIATIITIARGSMSLKDNLVLFPVELFGIQSSFLSLFSYSHNGGTWFISCILMCYLVFPLIKHIFQYISNKTRVRVLVILTLLLLWAPVVQYYFQIRSIYSNPFFHMIEFAIGSMLFFISKEDNQSAIVSTLKKSAMYLVALLLLIVTLSTLFYAEEIPHDYMLYNIVVIPLFSIMVISGANMKVDMLKDSKIIQYLSGLTFTFFLCQVLPLWGISRLIYNILGFEIIFMRIIISLTICLIVAIALHELIKKPITKLLKRKILN